MHGEIRVRVRVVYHGNMFQKYQWILFWLTCGVIALVLCVRLWVLLPLYTNASLRGQAYIALTETIKQQGWLSSGVSIHHVSNDTVEVLYRSYMRGEDTIECHAIDLMSRSLSSCDAS